MINFGDKLKNLRVKAGKSQAKVAAEISQTFPDFSISQTYLSALEQREDNPKDEIIEALAEYFNVPIAYFYDGERSISPEDEQRRMDIAESWIEGLRHSNVSGQSFARAEGFQKDDDEISKSLEKMRKAHDEDDEILDF